MKFSKKHGYITLAQEEICSSESIWTTQTFFDVPNFDHLYGSHFCDSDIKYKFCFGGKPLHHYTLQYFQQFISNYEQVPKFAIMDLLAAHEVPPTPTLARLEMLDDYLLDTLKFIMEFSETEGRESVIIIAGDHGLHRSWYSHSKVGRLEHKLPMLQLILPNSLLKNYPISAEHNLEKNQGRLLTTFDLYTTIQHLLQPFVARPDGVPSWSYSLFESIPEERTCEQAKIPIGYCACDYAEEQWQCMYDGEESCNCSTKSCERRSKKPVKATKWQRST